jgi:hypothetical protein
MGVSGEMRGNSGEELKVDFNAEDTECPKRGTRELWRTGDGHGKC